MELDEIMPILPIIMSALAALTFIAFSPVAALSAPALIIFAVAMEFVPNAASICSPPTYGLNFSIMLFPIPPPCPSTTIINIKYPPYTILIGVKSI